MRFWNVREVFRVSETALTVSLRAISSFRGRRSRTSSAICVPICAGNLPAQESVTEVCKSCIGGRDYVRCAGDVNRAPRMLECLVLCEYRASGYVKIEHIVHGPRFGIASLSASLLVSGSALSMLMSASACVGCECEQLGLMCSTMCRTRGWYDWSKFSASSASSRS